MKTSKKIAIYSALLLLLSSCAPTHSNSSSSNGGNSSSNGPIPPSSTSSESATNSSSNYDTSTGQRPSSESSLDTPKPSGLFRFYSVNDFHGSVLPNGYEKGLLSYFSFLADEVDRDPEHTIILSAGDMYQGSYESNSNYGALLTETMNAVPFDAMTLGNHEFDYGLDRLYANIERANFPMLAGNIVHYYSKESWGKTELSTIVEKGGAKIGIIGMIGEGQTTSINAKIVRELEFTSPKQLTINEAKRLKEEEKCDIVVLSIHADKKAVDSWNASSYLSSYIDGVFCGHSHTLNTGYIGSTPCLQAYSNGKDYSYMTMELSKGKITKKTTDVIEAKSTKASSRIQEVYDRYMTAEVTNKTSVIAGTVTNGTIDKYGVARLGCKAIYEKYKESYPGLALAMENSQRATLSEEITYGDIYKATPFTNSIVIADLRGDEIKNEARYNLTYTGDVDRYSTLIDNTYYTVALIDYLYYHQNIQKKYDYFPSLNGLNPVFHGEYETYPADLTFDYVKNVLNGNVNAADYTSSAAGFDLYGNPER